MASLWKHPQSKYWVACFTDHTGKQRKKSTKTTDKKAALKFANTLEDAYRRRLSEAQFRKVLGDAYKEIHAEPLSSSTIASFLNGWVKRKEKEVSQSTFHKYKTVSSRFLEFLGESADKDLNYLNSKVFVGFRDAIAEKLSVASANGYLKVLRVAFKDAWRDNLMLDNPAAKTPILKRSASEENTRRAFTLDELKRVLAVATPEWKGIIVCGLYTGQRLGDLVRLRWNAVDLAQKEIRFLTSKTGRPVVLPIAKPLLEHLVGMESTDDPTAPVFPKAYKIVETNGKTAALSNQFYDIMAAAALVPLRGHRKIESKEGKARQANSVSFHCLRHTATSLLKNAGVSEAVAMDIIGHESKAVSLNYTHIDTDAKRNALERLPDINA